MQDPFAQDTSGVKPGMVSLPRTWATAIEWLVYKSLAVGRSIDNSEVGFQVACDLWKFWKHFYPQEYSDFIEQQKKSRQMHFNKHASAREKGGAQVRHLAEFPGRWHELMYQFFPDQRWTGQDGQRFVKRLIKYIPELQVPDKV